VEHVVFFGLQYYILAYLKRQWDMTFFRRPKEEALSEFSDFMLLAGLDNRTDHLGALHDLGYLPLEIWALPEGEHVPIGVPSFVMWNTKPEFFWLTNYLETQISAAVWGPSTSATIAYQFRQALGYSAFLTGGDPGFVEFQGHDFSYRGMYGNEAAAMSGAGHLLSFRGSDTLPAIDFLERYYGGGYVSQPTSVGTTIPATEHSVMCAGGKVDELETFRYWMSP
jgi:nicotinamide phosphoribosyltransferase